MHPTRSQHPSLVSNTRTAHIASSGETVVGVCIFLDEGDLRELGVDPEAEHQIEYTINSSTQHLVVTSGIVD